MINVAEVNAAKSLRDFNKPEFFKLALISWNKVIFLFLYNVY